MIKLHFPRNVSVMCHNFTDYFPPIFILVLVLYSYYTYVVVFCILFVTGWVKKSIYIVIYHLLVIMFVWCFFTTMCKEHEAVPDEYRLTSKEHLKLIMNPQQEIHGILQKIISLRRLEIYSCTDMGQIRYCKDCHLLKPDRTHHCSTCERCILKMDHHCPWVANCVGYSNYKQFVLALLYAFLWTSFCTTTIGAHALELWKDFSGSWQKIVIGVGFGIFGFSTLLVLSLLGYHVVLLCRNDTTLEASREVCFREEYLSFNVGCWNNFTQVFGNNVCCWLLPVFTALGNGHEFPVTRRE